MYTKMRCGYRRLFSKIKCQTVPSRCLFTIIRSTVNFNKRSFLRLGLKHCPSKPVFLNFVIFQSECYYKKVLIKKNVTKWQRLNSFCPTDFQTLITQENCPYRTFLCLEPITGQYWPTTSPNSVTCCSQWS